jgi:hypothetical protein
MSEAVKFFRFRSRQNGQFARERVRVHSDTVGIRLVLSHRYPPTVFDYVLEESKSCAIAHGPVEWRHHAVRQVGECQSCGQLFDWIKIDRAHEAALEQELDEAYDEARSRHCSGCGNPEDRGTVLFGDRVVVLCKSCWTKDDALKEIPWPHAKERS